jgi:hypothetical protein
MTWQNDERTGVGMIRSHQPSVMYGRESGCVQAGHTSRTHSVVVLVVGLVGTLLVVDVLPLLVTGGLGLASHLVDHLLSVFFLQRMHHAMEVFSLVSQTREEAGLMCVRLRRWC